MTKRQDVSEMLNALYLAVLKATGDKRQALEAVKYVRKMQRELDWEAA